MTTTSIPDGLQAQRRLIDKLEAENFGWDLMVGDAFVRGMRDIGYKSTSFALAELIDNAMQAAASRIDLVFGFDVRTSAMTWRTPLALLSYVPSDVTT